MDGEESGRGRRERGDEAEDGLRDVIYVQASKTTVCSFSDSPRVSSYGQRGIEPRNHIPCT